jgi:cellulose synthase/poly-beta-1,6-N-acetylglucosamine synthase-like glycosyltransferase
MQMETDFKLVYVKDAFIYHLHRSSLRGFFRQRKTWGYGEVLLCRKYLSHYVAKDVSFANRYKKSYQEIARDRKRIFKLLYKFLFSRHSSKNRIKLDILAILGRKYGRILGSYREKFFFV